jgi:hypothetical protein
MKRHMCARGLVVGAMSVLALAASAGVAQADADPFTPSIPGIIDQIVTETPDLFADQRDEGGPWKNSDRVGMVCENLFARCR